MSKEEITEELKKEVTIEGGWSEPKIKNILVIYLLLIPFNLV